MFNKKIISLKEEKAKLEKRNIELENEIFNSNREQLNLTGIIDDMQEEILHILDKIENILVSNNYGRPDVANAKAVEEIRYQKDIIEKDLDNKNSYLPTTNQNR